MCGIAAVLAPAADRSHWLRAALSRIEHRGLPPTLYETSSGDGVGWSLGTHRLPIVAPEQGRQPVVSPAGTLVVCLNGEVFNHAELAAELNGSAGSADEAGSVGSAGSAGSAGRPAQLRSDTRVLAAALERWGIAATLERLIWEGAFLALEPATGRLWAARDHLGIKPLYTARFQAGRGLASEIKALVDLPGCDRVDPVPPGTAECYDGQGALVERLVWWRPGGRERRPIPADDAKRELVDLLRGAVHARVPREGSYAVALSGGLDSSAILRLAVETGRRPTAYVLHRPGSPDLPHARRLCRELGVELVEVPGLGADELRDRLSEVVTTVEAWEWQVVNHAAPMLPLTEAIHRDGNRVVLSGEGADELFLGYSRDGSSAAPEQEQLERVAALHRTNCRRLDRMGMRDQLEFRVPFLDRALTEWALSLPAELLVRDRVPKWLLREAMRGLLPYQIIDRRKLSMSRGAGYDYSPGSTPTVFGTLPVDEDFASDTAHRLARYPAEQVFLERFLDAGYGKADYLLEHSR